MAAMCELLPADVFNVSADPKCFRGLVNDWQALNRWTPNYLASLSAGKTVDVVYGNREYGSPVFKSMELPEFFHRAFSVDAGGPRLYLKEFELLEELPELKDDIDLELFQFAGAQSFHEAWIGQRGARTGLHCDIFNNFLIHISGTKQIDLIAPSCSAAVYPSTKFDFCARLSLVDGFRPDLQQFPEFPSAMNASLKFRLEPGDVIYIPRGWWHQVESLTPTISLSGFVVARADRLSLAIERFRRHLHNLGLYKRGNCTCHE